MRASVLFLSPRSDCAEQDGALADGMRWLKWEDEGEEGEEEESVGVAAEGRMEDDGWAGEGRGDGGPGVEHTAERPITYRDY